MEATGVYQGPAQVRLVDYAVANILYHCLLISPLYTTLSMLLFPAHPAFFA